MMDNFPTLRNNPKLAMAIRQNFLKLLKRHPKWTMDQRKLALHKYILLKFKVNIPRKSICHNHQAPFDFVAAAFFEQYDTIIAVANRNGGKTIDFAILAILDAIANDDC